MDTPTVRKPSPCLSLRKHTSIGVQVMRVRNHFVPALAPYIMCPHVAAT